jgi:hypothetical protein
VKFGANAFGDDGQTPEERLSNARAHAEAWRSSLVNNGDTWAIPGWPGAGPLDAADGQSAGVNIGTKTPSIGAPPGTETVNFLSTDWILV